MTRYKNPDTCSRIQKGLRNFRYFLPFRFVYFRVCLRKRVYKWFYVLYVKVASQSQSLRIKKKEKKKKTNHRRNKDWKCKKKKKKTYQSIRRDCVGLWRY